MRNTKKTFSVILIVVSAIIFIYSAGNGASDMSGVERIEGASVESVQEQSVIKGAGPYSNIAIGSIDATADVIKEYKSQVQHFKSSLVDDLKGKKKFKKVIAGNKAPGKTVIVTGKVIDMKIVDVETRRRKGAWAGKSNMDVYLKLTDSSNGKVIKEIIVSTYNNPVGAGWSGGSTDQSMPSDMGKIISAYLATVIPVK